MAAELKRCVTWFINFLDFFIVGYVWQILGRGNFLLPILEQPREGSFFVYAKVASIWIKWARLHDPKLEAFLAQTGLNNSLAKVLYIAAKKEKKYW